MADDSGRHVLFANRWRTANLERCRALLGAQPPEAERFQGPWKYETVMRLVFKSGKLIAATDISEEVKAIGATAAEKAEELLLHLIVAIVSVSIVIGLALGCRPPPPPRALRRSGSQPGGSLSPGDRRGLVVRRVIQDFG